MGFLHLKILLYVFKGVCLVAFVGLMSRSHLRRCGFPTPQDPSLCLQRGNLVSFGVLVSSEGLLYSSLLWGKIGVFARSFLSLDPF